MKQLPPLIFREQYYAGVERQINDLFRDIIYAPLMRLMAEPHPEYHNASGNALVDAVTAGTVWYDEGRFSGAFNSRITKALREIGALYHAPSRTWLLPPGSLPFDVRAAQARADMRYDALRRGFLSTLSDIDVNLDAMIAQKSRTKEAYKKTVWWMQEDFAKSVRAISIPPALSETQSEMIASEYGENLNKYIKKWSAGNILELREKVQTHAYAGRRAQALEGLIRENYGVSQRKAKFLARQETSLLLSKFRESRYSDVGVRKYRWSTSHDERVRSDHRHLNGKIFCFDEPPVTDKRTGARNNPGEDFGCRCVAIGLVE